MGSKEDFIADLYPSAKVVSEETGMSWQLILAQAAQETGWGEKVLPGTNNIFNIKADPSWSGPSRTFHVREEVDGKEVWENEKFRVYGSVKEALEDRVKFLKENPRYTKAGLFEPGTLGNMEKEANALKKGHYASDHRYAEALRDVFDGPTMRRAITQAEHGKVHPRGSPDGVLEKGDRGERVSEMQDQLRNLGYGEQLGGKSSDGKFGPRTEEAVKTFQRDHGLKDDGIVGSQTMKAFSEAAAHSKSVRTLTEVNSQRRPGASMALPEESLSTTLLSDKAHPVNGMYEQALAGVKDFEKRMGHSSGPHTANVSGALTAAALKSGMDRIDRVALSDDASRAYAMQGDASSPFKKYAEVDVAHAAKTPLAESSAQTQNHLQIQEATRSTQQQSTHQEQASPQPTVPRQPQLPGQP